MPGLWPAAATDQKEKDCYGSHLSLAVSLGKRPRVPLHVFCRKSPCPVTKLARFRCDSISKRKRDWAQTSPAFAKSFIHETRPLLGCSFWGFAVPVLRASPT